MLGHLASWLLFDVCVCDPELGILLLLLYYYYYFYSKYFYTDGVGASA